MENYSVYEDIANRTGGDIYIGVVGPVRTGKSTFIRRFMETLVLPQVPKDKIAEMTDELPQAGAGKTVMTTEPKFVPAKAVKIMVKKGAEASVRLVDCVGFAVDGANGFDEDGQPRLVKTPWSDTPMPFEKAGEIGTEKVIKEHSTIGVLVTTDGSITELERSAYITAEERAVAEIKSLGKPFVIVLNCKDPKAQNGLKKSLEDKYGAPVVALNAEKMSETEICEVLQKALFEFPLISVDIVMPKWLQSFPEDNRIVCSVLGKIKKLAPSLVKMRDCFLLETLFDDTDDFINPSEIKMDLGKGRVEVSIGVKDGLFYRVMSEECGEEIDNDLKLMKFVCSLAKAREGVRRIQDGFTMAKEKGYGIVLPTEEDYKLQKPELIKKSAGYGVQFQAGAVTYHIVKVEVGACVSPIIGTKEQGEDFVADTVKRYEEGEGQVWDTNIFGKSLRSLIVDELGGKAENISVDLRKKLCRTMTKIVNDGKNNLICFVF